MWCVTNPKMLSKMAAGGHLGFAVFNRISKTVGLRAKPMKIWARRVKVRLAWCLCGVWLTRAFNPKMADGGHLGIYAHYVGNGCSLSEMDENLGPFLGSTFSVTVSAFGAIFLFVFVFISSYIYWSLQTCLLKANSIYKYYTLTWGLAPKRKWPNYIIYTHSIWLVNLPETHLHNQTN